MADAYRLSQITGHEEKHSSHRADEWANHGIQQDLRRDDESSRDWSSVHGVDAWMGLVVQVYGLSQWKFLFIKVDVTGNNDFVGREVKAPIPTGRLKKNRELEGPDGMVMCHKKGCKLPGPDIKEKKPMLLDPLCLPQEASNQHQSEAAHKFWRLMDEISIEDIYGGSAALTVHRECASFDEIAMEQSLLLSESVKAISSSSFSLSDTKQAARVQLRVTAKEKPLTNQQLGIQNFVPAQAKCKLIIWDEAPMANKLYFEALDHSLRDILRKNRYDTCQQPFGNMMMVFGSDFGQVLPVIPKGSRQDIVSASLKKPYLWDHCNVLKLTANMRLTMGTRLKDVTKIKEFT
ncbi:ATP-dependent DNA helicase PIF1-like protein [Tanacetum coccineum]